MSARPRVDELSMKSEPTTSPAAPLVPPVYLCSGGSRPLSGVGAARLVAGRPAHGGRIVTPRGERCPPSRHRRRYSGVQRCIADVGRIFFRRGVQRERGCVGTAKATTTTPPACLFFFRNRSVCGLGWTETVSVGVRS